MDTPAPQRTRLHARPPQSTPTHRKQLRVLVREGCENRPGVYRMLGPTGLVIYVGQSRVLRTRLLSYFRAKGRDKGARILRHAFQIEWEYTNTEFGALLRELRLIKQYRPHFNSMMVQDEWPRAYVALVGGSVPGLRVVARSDDPGAIALFGPFRRVAQLREAVRALAEGICQYQRKPQHEQLSKIIGIRHGASEAPRVRTADGDLPHCRISKTQVVVLKRPGQILNCGQQGQDSDRCRRGGDDQVDPAHRSQECSKNEGDQSILGDADELGRGGPQVRYTQKR